MENILGKKLKQLRKLNKLSVEFVINKLREKNMYYSVQSLYKWEEGTAKPNIYVLTYLSHIYKCTINYLLAENEEYIEKLNNLELVLLKFFRKDSNFRHISILLSERFENI